VPIEPIYAERGTPEAERRQLTVLFCDLVDSTALSGQLDPEELGEVVQAYQAACAEVIQRYDGHIAQYLGDGLLVYFGYPQAHEDDARRAIHTGLGMVEASVALNSHLAQSKGIRLAVRVGIHTGLVVVGEMGSGGRQERLALGETPNVAARLQGIAAPDTVVASVATLRLVQGLFSAEDLGSHMLKGVATPIQVYRVGGESGAPSRLNGAVTRGRTPLVGRELEVTLLLECWAQVQEGIGQVVWLSGEPGIGKSRLVGMLKDHVIEQPHTRAEVGQAYSRARELCQQVQEPPQLVQILYGLWHFHTVRAEFHTVVDLSEELLVLARSVHDPLYLIGAHWELGSARFLLGQFLSAREHLDQSFAFYDPQQHRANASLLYGWFAEGFDTADLQEAKALLQALG
jgi:class 3 adenylate cyclase